MAKRVKPVLRLKISGPGVRRGRIPVPELIRLCEEAQKAVIRQAEALEGRNVVHHGPASSAIREECTLELIGIKSGSTLLEFGFAKPQMRLPETLSLGSEAITQLTRTIKSLSGTKKKKAVSANHDVTPSVLHGIMGLGRAAQNKKLSTLELIAPSAGPKKPQIVAAITQQVTNEVAKRLSRPTKAIITVDGYLEMADFKPRERKCRIEPPMGAAITCTFTEEQENTVNALIRHPVRITGEATYPPNSEKIDIIKIVTIEPRPSLTIGEANFFSNVSLDDLAVLQDVRPIKEPSRLAGGFPEDEDIDSFLREIYENRK